MALQNRLSNQDAGCAEPGGEASSTASGKAADAMQNLNSGPKLGTAVDGSLANPDTMQHHVTSLLVTTQVQWGHQEAQRQR
jgi:hypothetical protein